MKQKPFISEGKGEGVITDLSHMSDLSSIQHKNFIPYILVANLFIMTWATLIRGI